MRVFGHGRRFARGASAASLATLHLARILRQPAFPANCEGSDAMREATQKHCCLHCVANYNMESVERDVCNNYY